MPDDGSLLDSKIFRNRFQDVGNYFILLIFCQENVLERLFGGPGDKTSGKFKTTSVAGTFEESDRFVPAETTAQMGAVPLQCKESIFITDQIDPLDLGHPAHGKIFRTPHGKPTGRIFLPAHGEKGLNHPGNTEKGEEGK